MEFLRELAGMDRIQSLLHEALDNPAVQGIVLEIDPMWLMAWDRSLRYGLENAERWFAAKLSQPGRPQLDAREEFEAWSELPDYFVPVRPLRADDLEWRPQAWAQYTGAQQALPLVVRIRLRPARENEREVRPAARGDGFAVVVETWPVAELHANPRKRRRPLVGGLSIGLGTQACGTLGGILKDGQNKRYGLTCGHVTSGATPITDQPAQKHSRKAGRIGQRGISSTLTAVTTTSGGAVCNPYAGVAINGLDASLIEIDGTVKSSLEVLDIGPISGITKKASLTPGQTVEVTGRTSGHRVLRIGGLAVTYQLQLRGTQYCFRDLFELRWPTTGRVLTGRPVQPGDSGAWVCNPDASGFGWCGMVVGGDPLTGYAIFSEAIEAWWTQQGLSLSVM